MQVGQMGPPSSTKDRGLFDWVSVECADRSWAEEFVSMGRRNCCRCFRYFIFRKPSVTSLHCTYTDVAIFIFWMRLCSLAGIRHLRWTTNTLNKQVHFGWYKWQCNMSGRHNETLSTYCLCTSYCAVCRKFANLKFRPADCNSICWHDTQNLISANIPLWSASRSLSDCRTVNCILLQSVWTDSTTARSVLQPNTNATPLSDQAKIFSVSFVVAPDRISTSAANVCCFPSAFPLLCQYFKIDHVWCLLNPFHFILLTALLSDDVHCDVSWGQCLYLPQKGKTTWQSDSSVFRSTYRNEGVSCC